MKTQHNKQEILLPCFVIYTTLNGHKTYVCGQCTRSDNKYLCLFNENKNKAVPFTSEEEVEAYKKKIYSLSIKQFHHEAAMLPASFFKPGKLPNPSPGVLHLLTIVLSLLIFSCSKQLLPVKSITESSLLLADSNTCVIQYDAYHADTAMYSVPDNYVLSDSSYPLLLFFHGTGEAENDGGIEALKRLGVPNYINRPKLKRFIVLCPQDYDGYRTADNINAIINIAIKTFRVDTSRIYLTGLSVGARNVLNYVTESDAYAKRIAAIVPMSVIYMDSLHLDGLKFIADNNIATSIYVGTEDAKYNTLNHFFYDAINSYKPGLAQLQEYEGAHCCWNDIYNPHQPNNIYDWLLQFTK